MQYRQPGGAGGITQIQREKTAKQPRIFYVSLLQTPAKAPKTAPKTILMILIILLSSIIHPCFLQQMIYNYHLLFKYIIVGDPNVGKSALLLKFIDNKFTQNYESTLGVQFGSKIFSVGSTVVKTMIWDTAGQQNFKSVIRSYYKNSIVALLVFDLTSPPSFESVQKWLDEIRTNANQNIRVVLVGNKADLVDRRKVRREAALEFAQSLNMGYYETSAKTGLNVSEVFTDPAKQLISDIQNKKLVVSSTNESMGIKIGNPDLRSNERASIQISIQSTNKKKGCC